MGVSTDAYISYGILFEEGFEFPWSDYDNGLDGDWWLTVQGFNPSVKVYDEYGEYIGGIKPSEAVISQYYAEKNAFKKAHPLPFRLVNVCSNDYPIYILAIDEGHVWAYRGHPQVVDPTSLVATDEQRQSLIEFCKTYDIDIEGNEPRWYLSSYWG